MRHRAFGKSRIVARRERGGPGLENGRGPCAAEGGTEKLELWALALPEVRPGDSLAGMLVEAAANCGGLRPGDVLVVASKAISKAEGLLVSLDRIHPSGEARRLASKTGLDARLLEVVLRNADDLLFVVPLRVLAERGIIDLGKLSPDPERARELLERFPCEVFVRRGGAVYSSAGVDSSNHPPGVVSVVPADPDAAARKLREEIGRLTGIDVPVVVTDSEYGPGLGTVDVARGVSGLLPVARRFGAPDRFGKPKFGGVDLIADEVAAAAALLMGQCAEGVPAVLVRGLRYVPAEEGLRAFALPAQGLAKAVRFSLLFSLRVLGWRWLARMVLRGLGARWARSGGSASD
ncbi:MAG: coenzyme F420-0:L-glutamate ligase [Firmicutes bacterium]|nr:coenzyme F420-0:L-glutamate ligase [Bacillota bacterium]